jgi:hypothetical protein
MRIGGLAAGMFGVGLLTGMASTAVAEEPSEFDCSAVMADMSGQGLSDMMSMMGGSMMGPDTMRGGMGPDGSGMPGALHQRHHPQASPEASE